jgi:hypothetical protein
MNMTIENQIDRLKTLNKIKVLNCLIQHNNLRKHRKKSIAVIKAFGNPINIDGDSEIYTERVATYFAILKRIHKILEEELT